MHQSVSSTSSHAKTTEHFDGPAPEVVRQVIGRALRAGASDIHLDPLAGHLRVRPRVDGALHKVGHIPKHLERAVVSRIKVLARLDVAERRLPQDGRIQLGPAQLDVHASSSEASQPEGVDLRVSTLPAKTGEKVVLRLLNRSDVTLDLGALGFDERDERLFQETIRRPHGLVLVTGPTGSGKTTTLYAALQSVRSEALNLQTIEDPVEYHLEGITQAQVHPAIGFTFATALRAFLRQDPDVLMVGEIRDTETAEIAVRAFASVVLAGGVAAWLGGTSSSTPLFGTLLHAQTPAPVPEALPALTVWLQQKMKNGALRFRRVPVRLRVCLDGNRQRRRDL